MARIIVADDDELVTFMVRSILENAGHIVGVLNGGQRVCDVASMKHPDLIILDCNMPDRSGIDAVRDIRASDTAFSIPIMMLTGRTGNSDRDIAYQAGADDYLKKPIDAEELLWRAQKLLAGRPVTSAAANVLAG